MVDNNTEIVGLVAGICTSLSLLPQLVKLLKNKKAEDISLFYLVILFIGLGMWIWYGFLREDVPIMATNGFSLVINGVIIVLGEYKNYLTVLRVGDLVMLGTPCDFSGELIPPLDSLAASLHKEVMVTSFSGGYIGYVTPGKYYDVEHYETQLMNWHAPGTGEYLAKSLGELMLEVSGTR